MEKEDIKKTVEELFRVVHEIKALVPEENAEMVIEHNCIPGGYYLVLSKTPDGGIAIQSGEYGRWRHDVVIREEEEEY